jgi:levansucrase
MIFAVAKGVSRFVDGYSCVLNSAGSLEHTTIWSPDQVAGISDSRLPTIPQVTAADLQDILPGYQLWDCWTIETAQGDAVMFEGWTPWVIMCAPRDLHPDLRHDVARLRLMIERAGEWRDCGYLLPGDLNPGSREWAGSTVYDPGAHCVTLFYTVTGRRGEASPSFEQRLFQTEGVLTVIDGLPRVKDWSVPHENVISDGVDYMIVDQHEGKPGWIKGFRDPFHFRDPADGLDYLLFTGSLQQSSSDHNGVIGIARSTDGLYADWQLLPPLISADGLNNELERPVLRFHDGLYYLFWSTQRKVFATGGPTGPTGLYGMVADSILGPYRPLNETALVAPNPAEEPHQTYSWWVTQALEVAGFVDLWGLDGQDPVADPELVAQNFGGTLAPRFRLALEGQTAHIIAS